jgi:hyaluronan synthase
VGGWLPEAWGVYVPLGLIGLWRWAVWALKRGLALLYRPRRPLAAPPPVSLVVPVFREGPAAFEAALRSWIAERPAEIVVVIDHGDAGCIEVFRRLAAAGGPVTLELIVTAEPGKRPALARGIRQARHEIVALVDSDTIWEHGVIAAATAPFADRRVAGVGTRQNVHEPRALWERMADVVLDQRFQDEMPFLARMGAHLTCLSGRTALYRRQVLLPLLPQLIEEWFLGERCFSGDDKRLTYLVQAAGHRTAYQSNARVYTFMPADFASFVKQRVRWSRNTWRADLRALSQSWSWRKPVFALFLIDRAISPLTSLLAPAFLVLALVAGHWGVAGILVGWWLVSRAVKIAPHLRRRPRDVVLVPVYVLLVYVLATVKIYALLTLNWQGWLTRGAAGRQAGSRWRRLGSTGLAALATGFAVSLVLAIVLAYGLLLSGGRTPGGAGPRGIAFEVARVPAPLVLADAALAEPPLPSLRHGSLEEREYVVGGGESLAMVARSAYGDAAQWRLVAYRNNLRPPYSLAPGQRLVLPTANLPPPPPATRLLPAFVRYDVATNTLVVTGRETAITLSEIAGYAPRGLLTQTAPGEWLLAANLEITDTVTLQLRGRERGGDADWLKLRSDAGGFVSLRTIDGRIVMERTRVTSWDAGAQGFDERTEDGRAFVLAKNSSTRVADTRLDIVSSELAYLGYSAPESYGVSWRVSKGGSRIVTGTVIGSYFHHNHFGAFTFGAQNMIWRGNEFAYNISYGLDPHDDSNYFLVEYNSFHHNGRHGLIFSKRCVGNVIRYNTSEYNRYHGFMLHEDSNQNLVEHNLARFNQDGFAVYESRANVLRQNTAESNRGSGFRLNGKEATRPTIGNYLADNQIRANAKGVYIYGFAPATILVGNTVSGQTGDGVDVRADGAFVGAPGRGNVITGNRRGIVLANGVQGAALVANQIEGQARDAVVLAASRDSVVRDNTIARNGGRGVWADGAVQPVVLHNDLRENQGLPVSVAGGEGARLARNTVHGGAYHIAQAADVVIEDADAHVLQLVERAAVDVVDRDGNVLAFGDGRLTTSAAAAAALRVRGTEARARNVSVTPAGLALSHDSGSVQLASLNRGDVVSWGASGIAVAGPVLHVVQGLRPGAEYQLEVDGRPHAAALADATGKAAFAYVGGYPEQGQLRRFAVRALPERQGQAKKGVTGPSK